VQTFQPTELVATKIRALYQRSKGRDLFDLWLALDHLHLDPKQILDAFAPYRPDGLSSALAITSLERKLTDTAFRADIEPLVDMIPDGYSIDGAAQLITDNLLFQLDRVK